MKKIILVLASIILFSMFVNSCKKNTQEIIPINKLKVYKDSVYKMEFKYPENWDFLGVAGDYYISSNKLGRNRFKRYDTKGKAVARLVFKRVKAQKDSNTRLDYSKFVDQVKKFELKYYQGPELLDLDGTEAQKFTYSFPLNDGMFNGVLVVAEKDSNSYTYFKFETFADGWSNYKEQVDEIISSLKFAQTPPPRLAGDTLFISEELPLPSEDTKLMKGKGFTIKIPKNFTAKKGSGNFKFSKKYEGERRRDSHISIDIMDAKKQKDLEKIVTKTAKSLKDPKAKVASISFGGQKGYVIEQFLGKYKIVRNLYFAKKGDDLYRVTIDYSKEEEKAYKKAFDKAIKSFKIK